MQTLHIVIPTYRRPRELLVTLDALAMQVREDVTITVLDNASPEPCEAYCVSRSDRLKELVHRGVLTFARNPYNVGMSANFLRAFERCQAEWLWILSDDDAIHPEAVARVLKAARSQSECPEVAFIKFNRGTENPAGGRHLTSLTELVDIAARSNELFNSYIFITNGLYRFPNFASQIEVGYRHLHTYVPHLVMLLTYVDGHPGERSVFLAEEEVASYVKPVMGYSYAFVAGLGVGAFKNFTFRLPKRQYQRLDNAFAAHNDYKVIIDLFYYCRRRSTMYAARYLARNYYLLIRLARHPAKRAALRLFCLLLWTPSLFEGIVRLIPVVAPSLHDHIKEIWRRNGALGEIDQAGAANPQTRSTS